MATRPPHYSYKGVSFTFLDTSVRLLEEVKCPVCLELLSEPVITSCHHLFCKDCIYGQETCPTCREEFITTTPDVGSTKLMKAFKVKCPNSSEGCRWQGDLGDAEEHLEKKCQYQKAKCPFQCKELLEGPQEEVRFKHHLTCENLPVSCPGCWVYIKRKNMQRHLSKDCPVELVPCKYALFGCEEPVERIDKDEHFSDVEAHLEKCMEAQLGLLGAFSKCMRTKSWETVDVTSLPLSFRPWLQNTPTCYPRPPWVIKFGGFEKRNAFVFSDEDSSDSDDDLCLDSDNEFHGEVTVFSHFGGYKMEIELIPQGRGSGKGTHLAVGVEVSGDSLPDFNGSIVVSLLNQLEDKNHHTREIWLSENSTIEANENTRWCYQFISHADLSYNPYKYCQFLKNGCLFFRVDKFEFVFSNCTDV